MPWFRAIGILWAIYVGYRGYRSFGSGTLRVGNFMAPAKVILRDEAPAAYWSFVILFYGGLLGAIALAAFAPDPA